MTSETEGPFVHGPGDNYRDWRAMDSDEFIYSGLLSEVNRRFFHPAGFALCVDGESGVVSIYETDDPSGYIFDQECLRYRAAQEYNKRFYERLPRRYAEYGYSIQPITEDMKDENGK